MINTEDETLVGDWVTGMRQIISGLPVCTVEYYEKQEISCLMPILLNFHQHRATVSASIKINSRTMAYLPLIKGSQKTHFLFIDVDNKLHYAYGDYSSSKNKAIVRLENTSHTGCAQVFASTHCFHQQSQLLRHLIQHLEKAIADTTVNRDKSHSTFKLAVRHIFGITNKMSDLTHNTLILTRLKKNFEALIEPLPCPIGSFIKLRELMPEVIKLHKNHSSIPTEIWLMIMTYCVGIENHFILRKIWNKFTVCAQSQCDDKWKIPQRVFLDIIAIPNSTANESKRQSLIAKM